MSTSNRTAAQRDRWIGLSAFIGTYLFIPLWDVFALGYTLLTSWQIRQDPETRDVGTSLLIRPLRRLAFLAIAFALALLGVGALQGVVPQPGPFGFAITGLRNIAGITPNLTDPTTSAAVAKGVKIAELISDRLPNTFWLLGAISVEALLLTAALFAIGLGTHALTRRSETWGWAANGLLRLLAFRQLAVPTFGVGLVWIMLFGVRYKWVPVGLLQTMGHTDLGDRLWHLLLPGLVGALLPSLLAAQAAVRIWLDWDQNGRPKESQWAAAGLEAARTFYDHAGWLLGGMMILESLFAIPGIGKLMIDGIIKQDAPVLVATVQLFAPFVLVARIRSILTDSMQRIYDFMHPAVIRKQAAVKPKASQQQAATSNLPMPERPEFVSQLWLVMAGIAFVMVLVPIIQGIFFSPHNPLQITGGQTYLPPSAEHPMGTDSVGRDIESRILFSHQVTFGTAVTGAIVVLALGGLWGGVAVAVRSWRGLLGESLADLIRLPAEVIMLVHPALVAMIFTVGQNVVKLPGQQGSQSLAGMSMAIGLSLAPRMVWAVEALWDSRPQEKSLRWRLGGAIILIYAASLFAVFHYAEALGFLGLGVLPPLTSVGANLQYYTELLGGTLAVRDSRFYVYAANYAAAAGFQAWVYLTMYDGLTDFFGFKKRGFMPKLFS